MGAVHQRPRSILFTFLAALVFAADRLTKYTVLRSIGNGVAHLFPGFSFSVTYNTGISFSLFSSTGAHSPGILIAIVATIVALMFIVWRYCASHSVLSTAAYASIIGGAVGNFYDRLYFGGVVDFIDLHAFGWHFPTFNIADVAISLGFILLLLETYYATKQ